MKSTTKEATAVEQIIEDNKSHKNQSILLNNNLSIANGYSNKLTYFSNKNKKPITSDISKDFYSIGIDINHDGK